MTAIDRIAVNLPLSPNVQQGNNVPKAGEKSFADVLESTHAQQTGLKYSEHAKARLRDRQIEISEQDQLKINGAVESAAQKGAEDSLLLLKDVALLVSIRNRTVITALDQQEQSQKVFTNIDSAVIIR
ncbi:flagellar protein [candidate division KSB1 bacterium]|nr:flagellar protein [candidate division KSB1 bacterium]